MSARAFVLVFALNFFLCSGQHYDDKIKPQDIQKREDSINKRPSMDCAKADSLVSLWGRLIPSFMNHLVLADMTKIGVNANRSLCDADPDFGGWIFIQRRIKGDVNFTRTWNDYKNGFGSNSGDFWIGNDVIYQLTNLGYNELRFDMKDKGKDYYAVYRGFKVENEAAKYKMSYTSFSSGNGGDRLSYHNGMKFTTIDSDNDVWSTGNCAVRCSDGWWYSNCLNVNLNGEWASEVGLKGIHWDSVTGWLRSLDFVEMKLRKM